MTPFDAPDRWFAIRTPSYEFYVCAHLVFTLQYLRFSRTDVTRTCLTLPAHSLGDLAAPKHFLYIIYHLRTLTCYRNNEITEFYPHSCIVAGTSIISMSTLHRYTQNRKQRRPPTTKSMRVWRSSRKESIKRAKIHCLGLQDTRMRHETRRARAVAASRVV